MQLVLTSQLLIEAYKQGLFPMSYSTESPYVHWVCPEMRGQLPIKNLHISKSLKRLIKQNIETNNLDIRIDSDFDAIIRGCAEETEDRPESWINVQIIDAYNKLHLDSHAHSVEVWQNDTLVGGVYGLKIGSAFFGESMYSRIPNASKVALVYLCARLWKGGFTILDTQFTNPHLEQFGVYEIPHEDYIKRLQNAIAIKADFHLRGLSQNKIIAEYLETRNL